MNSTSGLAQAARALAGVALAGLALMAGGCDAASVTIDGMKGVPLAELDLTGQVPDEISLLGPDKVEVRAGDRLAISVDGADAVKERLRFTLDDGKLAIGRSKGGWNDQGTATITVTVPAVRRLVLAGSGTIDSEALTGPEAGVTIAGSGKVGTRAVEAQELKVEVLGSGSLAAAGRADRLRLVVAGSGEAMMDTLTVQSAKVDVAGSGSARFASDGEVKASIMGSGEVRVKGRATCKVTAMGSGKLVCEP